MTHKAVDELNELVVAEGLHADKVEKVSEITIHICCCWVAILPHKMLCNLLEI